jgi:hypothetical protein
MKTDDFVAMLAAGVEPVPPHVAARRYALALGLGAVVATAMLATLLGVRPDLLQAMTTTAFWVKLAFPSLIAAASLVGVARLSRPGARLGKVPMGVAAPVVAMWLLGTWTLAAAQSGERASLLLGQTWAICPFNIAMLSVPLFIGALWAMKGLAPTRLTLAGAVAGLLAGSMGATVYVLHCPEMAPPFLGIWYLLGMLVPAAAGALVGKRLLRW